MTYLIFDTETTGLPLDYNAHPSNLQNWPRIVQIAWTLCDENGNRLKTFSAIIEPEGFQIPPNMVHGISQERAKTEGRHLEVVLYEFEQFIIHADALVCHNYDFDAPIVGAEFIRAFGENPIPNKKAYCTQKQATHWARIPNPNRRGYGQHKWPSLAELHELCGYGEIENAHDALADVAATSRCFLHLLHTAPSVFASPYFIPEK